MKRIVLILGLIGILFGMFGLAGEVSADDPFLTSQSLYFADFPKGGSVILEEYLNNVTPKPQTITIMPWYENGQWYANAFDEDKWMDVSWISNITPTEVQLPGGNKALINITLTLPDGVPDGKYVGWLKISDGVYNKPVSLVIRVGSAIPTYEFKINRGSYYRLFVDGMPAYIDVNTGEDFTPIEIKSTSSAQTVYQARVFEMGDRTISADSAVVHSPDEVGQVFTEIPIEDSSQWLTLSCKNGGVGAACTVSDPIILEPFGSANIYWKLELPDTLKDGHYVINIRISPAAGVEGTNITCDYAIPFLIDVHRAPHLFKWQIWMTALAAAVVCSLGVGIMVVLEKRKQASD